MAPLKEDLDKVFPIKLAPLKENLDNQPKVHCIHHPAGLQPVMPPSCTPHFIVHPLRPQLRPVRYCRVVRPVFQWVLPQPGHQGLHQVLGHGGGGLFVKNPVNILVLEMLSRPWYTGLDLRIAFAWNCHVLCALTWRGAIVLGS